MSSVFAGARRMGVYERIAQATVYSFAIHTGAPSVRTMGVNSHIRGEKPDRGGWNPSTKDLLRATPLGLGLGVGWWEDLDHAQKKGICCDQP